MSSGPEHIDGRLEYREAVEQLAGLATRDIALYSPRLPAYSYASEACIDALKRWAIGNDRAQARIIVHEARYAVAEAHRLIHLGLQLSSSFSFRDAPGRMEPFGDILIIDGRHLLKRSLPESSVATLWLDQPIRARAALRDYDKLWEESTPSIEIRRQSL